MQFEMVKVADIDGATDLVDVYGDLRPDPEWDDEANGVEVGQDELNDTGEGE